jgi:hypothetical protein
MSVLMPINALTLALKAVARIALPTFVKSMKVDQQSKAYRRGNEDHSIKASDKKGSYLKWFSGEDCGIGLECRAYGCNHEVFNEEWKLPWLI